MVAPTFLPNFPNTKGQTSEKSYSEKMSEDKVSVVLKSIMLNYSISNIHTGGNHLTIKCQKTTTTKKKKKKKKHFPKSVFLSKLEQLH